jgi:hypothetical protein
LISLTHPAPSCCITAAAFQILYHLLSSLPDSKSFGKNTNTRREDDSIKEPEELYNDSKNSDPLPGNL